MSLPKSTYYSKLYLDFKSIHPEAHREIIRFFDENENAIRQLDGEEYFELYVSYVNALFIIGKYRRHLVVVDHVIESAIHKNIFVYNEQDLFFEMLTGKACSLLYTYEFEKAEVIFRQLIRIDPQREEIVQFLEKSIRRQGAPVQLWTRALGIGLLILGAVLIGVEILLIRPFYEMHTTVFEWSRNLLILSACTVMVAGEVFHRHRCYRRASTFRQQIAQDKIAD